MTSIIRSEEVRKLLYAFRNIPEGARKETVRGRLDSLADQRRYERAELEADDCRDQDETIDSLAGFGSGSFAKWMYGD